MSRLDMAWRLGGTTLFLAACSAPLVMAGSTLVLLALPVALIGLTLMVNGKRAAIMLRAERRGHAHTAEVIHAVRLRRRRQPGREHI